MAGCCAPCACVLWLLVLVFISWPVSCICFFFYCFVGPLAGWCSGVEPLADFLVQGVKFPQTCAKNMCG